MRSLDNFKKNNIKQNKSCIRRQEESLIDLNSLKVQLVIGVQECGKESLCLNVLKKANVKYIDFDFNDPDLVEVLEMYLDEQQYDNQYQYRYRQKESRYKDLYLVSDYKTDRCIYENVGDILKGLIFNKLNGNLSGYLNGKLNDVSEGTSKEHLQGKTKRIYYNNIRNDINKNYNLADISKCEELGIFLGDFIGQLFELYDDFEYVFINEIHKVKGWYKLVIKLLRDKIHVIATSSSAKVFDGNFISHLIGRMDIIHLYPLSYRDFCAINKVELDGISEKLQEKELLDSYVKQGGFPELSLISKNKSSSRGFFKLNYLKQRKTVINKIIESKNSEKSHVRNAIFVRNEIFIKKFIDYLSGCVPCVINFQEMLKICKVKSNTTLRKYISILKEIYFIVEIYKYTPVRQKRVTKRKIYFVDTLLMKANSKLSLNQNAYRMFETVVLLEILRQSIPKGYDVYYYSDRSSECDFLICKNRKVVLAIQNCYFIKKDISKYRDLIEVGKKLNCRKLLILNNNFISDCYQISMYTVLYYRNLSTLNLSEWLN